MNTVLRRVTPVLLVVSLFVGTPGAALAEDRLRLIVFGDSLSDSGGNPAPSPPYFEGRWSNGYTYVDAMAAQLGIADTLTPSSVPGGTNYARAGARITGVSGAIEQIASYLHDSGWTADPRALYVVLIGGNDVRDGLTSAFTNPSFNPVSFVDNRLAALAVTLNGLSAMGARKFAVLSLPDLSRLPGLPPPAMPLASFMSARFNAGFARIVEQLDDKRGRGVLVDVASLFQSVIADAAAGGVRFGITNVTQPCLVLANGVVVFQCANPDEYLFWDPIHPTGRMHGILADYVIESLDRRGRRHTDDQ